MSPPAVPDLSILVCAYNMARELPRTLLSLSHRYQRGTDGLDWEVVVLDNGSEPPVDAAALQAACPGVRVVRPDTFEVSPAAAINAAMRSLRGRMLGLWIDGARLASPGIVGHAIEAWRTDPGKVIGSLAFHLGPDVQMRTVGQGYDADAEDTLLRSVPWRQDGYRLFEISVLAGSSSGGWFGCINESNGLFMDRSLWETLGGLDERFKAPGGGFVNLDLWERAVAASGGQPWIILGEGTFHQVHGGVATNGPREDREAMRAEYAKIHGRPWAQVVYRAQYVGELDHTRFASGQPSALEPLRRVHSVRQRHFRVGLPPTTLARIQRATLATRYKGLRLAKNPFDLALYLRLLGTLRPATIIEVGTSEGGSAVWLLDQCRALGLAATRVISIDINPPSCDLPGIELCAGDAYHPEDTFPVALLESAPRPWLVIEDSAHTYASTTAVLRFFERRLKAGDHLVVEDGVLSDLAGEGYRALEDGPNRAVAEFLGRVGQRFSIDETQCDFYGPNVTYAPNAWLRCN